MAIDPEDVRRVAELARLELPEAELEKTARELSAVLDFVATLKRLDLAGLAPSTFASPAGALRDDVTDPRRLDPERATAEAPEAEDGFFIVPPIVESVQP
jgi:aspartyl-tRNA(Asn)/glutamyl-tRNA(Gln) amidotransferase subunit C